MQDSHWHTRARALDYTVQHVINGETITCEGDQAIIKQSPRDGSELYRFSVEANGAAVDKAVANAREAYNDGRWRTLSTLQRKTILQQWAALIEANKDELALADCLDVGKPISAALHGDIHWALTSINSVTENMDKIKADCGAEGSWLAYQVHKPVGVVGSIIGWNFPLSLAVTKIAPALAMGNSLVLKPSEFTPLSAQRLAVLALEAGVPPGVFNVVQGTGAAAGAQLAHHPDIDLLSFTGSSATGKQLMQAAGQSNMKRLMLECGGKSPFIVFEDCDDLDAIAADIVETGLHNQGAYCSASTRLLIQASIKEPLLEKICQHAAQLQPQDPLHSDTSFGALINEAHLNKVLTYIDIGQQEGARLIQGGQRIAVDTGTETQGYYLEPAIFDDVKPQHRIAQEEIFGPVLSVFTFNDEAEAIAMANDTCYGLAAYAATQHAGRAQRLAQQLNSGFL